MLVSLINNILLNQQESTKYSYNVSKEKTHVQVSVMENWMNNGVTYLDGDYKGGTKLA